MRAVSCCLGVALVASALGLAAGPPPPEPAWAPRVWLHAHNCYPDEGRGTDRLSRALAATRGTVAIEQDVVWDARRGQSVVSHDTELNGTEPTLEAHFFEALSARLDEELATRRTETWPLVVLHLDFKTDEPEHHAAIWTLLGRYQRWLTTAPRVDAAAEPQPLSIGPVLVLTEQGHGQERTFHDAVPLGAPLKIFGTVPTPEGSTTDNAAVRRAQAVAAAPDALIPSGATNYRRWTNHSWAVVEEGGPPRAGAWTDADARRLTALVARAHARGLWIRFYTLNGHRPNDAGWSDGYNFGSLETVRPRWRAAIDAGVDFVATDQYEEFSDLRSATAR
jgi:hypothetical protein